MSGSTVTSQSALNSALADNTTGNITPQVMRNVNASVLNIAPAIVSAAGTNFGTATVLTNPINIVTSCSAGQGVVATAAYTEVWNETAVACLVYPISGAQLTVAGTTYSTVSVAAYGVARISMTSSTLGSVR